MTGLDEAIAQQREELELCTDIVPMPKSAAKARRILAALESAKAMLEPASAPGRDPVGVCIDHANAALDLIEAHAKRAGVSSGEMLHTVATAWIDRRADERLVSRTNPNVQRLTNALANLDAQRMVNEERRS